MDDFKLKRIADNSPRVDRPEEEDSIESNTMNGDVAVSPSTHGGAPDNRVLFENLGHDARGIDVRGWARGRSGGSEGDFSIVTVSTAPLCDYLTFFLHWPEPEDIFGIDSVVLRKHERWR